MRRPARLKGEARSTVTTERTLENREGLAEVLLSRSVETVDGCRVWIGGTRGTGYGAIRVQGRQWAVHHVAYALAHGSIPAGVLVRHTCGRRLCICPEHLVAGSDQDNAQDALNHGASAGLMPRRRLPARQRQAILSLVKQGFSRHEVHRLLDVPLSTIKKIARRGI